MNQKYDPQITSEELLAIKPGYIIERMLAFSIPCYLKVTEIKDHIIYCGEEGWTFSNLSGIEIDKDIPVTVSYIRRAWATEEEAQPEIDKTADLLKKNREETLNKLKLRQNDIQKT